MWLDRSAPRRSLGPSLHASVGAWAPYAGLRGHRSVGEVGGASHPLRIVANMRSHRSRRHLRLVPDPAPALVIDCAVCVARASSACTDCLVTHLVGHEEGGKVELDVDERRAVEMLAEAGLVPRSRFEPRGGATMTR